MKHSARAGRGLVRCLCVAAVAGGLALPSHAQTLKVLTAGAFKQIVLALAPTFEAGSELNVDVQNDTAGSLLKRVQAGETFDVLIATPTVLASLAKEGLLDAATMHAVARVAIGVAVRTGDPLPPLETVDQFKQAITGARKVAYIDPASGGSSGIYLTGLFSRLGIADEVRSKAVLVPGGLVADRVASGEADLAIHQVSEILPVKGVKLAGLLPDSIQNCTTYAAGAATASRQPDAARAFVALLTSPQAIDTLRAKGMTPPP
ncbi:MAG: substrate-binding domain-containing protein [Rubrivivax sp.]